MDDVQNCDSYINTLSLQIYRLCSIEYCTMGNVGKCINPTVF
jgi:hypothetical protein